MGQLWWTVVDAPWRVPAAALLGFAGIAILARGLWFGSAASPGLFRQGNDAYAWIKSFQWTIFGLVVVGVAAAWAWRQPWLLVVSLGVLGEEMYETSRILTVLKRSPSRRVGRGRAGSPPVSATA